MSEANPIPTYEVVLPSPPEDKWHREYHAFLHLLPDLLKAHRGKYVAVHDGQVVGSGEDKIAVAMQAYARYGYVPIYVGLVTDEPPRIEHIRSPRLLAPRRAP
jgi:hypothetical protein